MASFKCRFGRFVPDRPGIIEIFTSGAMQGELRGLAEPLAEKASSEARANLHHGGFKDEGTEPYEAEVVDHDRTAVAFVHPVTQQGFTNEKLHHTLNSLNH